MLKKIQFSFSDDQIREMIEDKLRAEYGPVTDRCGCHIRTEYGYLPPVIVEFVPNVEGE